MFQTQMTSLQIRAKKENVLKCSHSIIICFKISNIFLSNGIHISNKWTNSVTNTQKKNPTCSALKYNSKINYTQLLFFLLLLLLCSVFLSWPPVELPQFLQRYNDKCYEKRPGSLPEIYSRLQYMFLLSRVNCFPSLPGAACYLITRKNDPLTAQLRSRNSTKL